MASKQLERDLVRRPCVAHLRDMQAYNQLKRYDYVYWICPPDMGKLQPHVAKKMVIDGYQKGVFDMTIMGINTDSVKIWLIEFKYGKNGYTKEQKIVADACEGSPVDAIKIYSIDEFEAFVEKELK